MKTINAIFVSVLFLFLYSCISPVTFTEPQPKGCKNILEFPDKLIGNYQNLEEGCILSINKNLVYKIYDFDLKQHIKDIDTTYKISGDFMICTETKERIPIKRDGDTIIEHINFTDTLFLISDANILRKFKGYYFLNKRIDNNHWTVEKLDLTKGKLTLGKISSKEDITKLNELVESPKDTISTHFNLTKRQFKKFIKNNGFNNTEVFQKVK